LGLFEGIAPKLLSLRLLRRLRFALSLLAVQQGLGLFFRLNQRQRFISSMAGLLCPMCNLCLYLLQALLGTLATFNHKTNFSFQSALPQRWLGTTVLALG
jgi:hypothetical protein